MQRAGNSQVLVRNERGDLLADLNQASGCGPQVTSLDIHAFAAGVYFYQVRLSYTEGGGEKLRTQKFVVLK
jgi:hypothetical protein